MGDIDSAESEVKTKVRCFELSFALCLVCGKFLILWIWLTVSSTFEDCRFVYLFRPTTQSLKRMRKN